MLIQQLLKPSCRYTILRVIEKLFRRRISIPRLLQFLVQDHSTIVQIGSNDGVSNDPINHLLLNNETLKALLIEAEYNNFRKLVTSYSAIQSRCQFENVIVGDGSPSTFYYINVETARLDPSVPSFVLLEQMHSLRKEVIESCMDGILKPHIVEKHEKTVRLEDLLSKHNILEVGLLHIDTEGYDWEILKRLIQKNHNPKLILFEKRHLSLPELSECTDILSVKYRLQHFEHDILCVRK